MSSHHFTIQQSIRVIVAMGWSDFLLKYRGSVLGYFWSLLGPLGKFLVILYVFGPFVSAEIPLYPMYLFLGIIFWEHFVNTTTGCMTMLEDKASIIQKLAFPRMLLVFMVGWTNMIIFLTHLGIFFIFAWLFGVSFTWSVTYVLLLLLQMTLIALGIGMILSSYCLIYRDIGHLWAIAVQLLFWLTPITYAKNLHQSFLPSVLGIIQRAQATNPVWYVDLFVQTQPVSILMHDAQGVLLYPQTLGAPSAVHALIFTLFCLMLFGLGALIFRRRSPYFPQEY